MGIKMKLNDRIKCYAKFKAEEVPSKQRDSDLIVALTIPGALTFLGKKTLDERYHPEGFKEKAVCYFMKGLPESLLIDTAKVAVYIGIGKLIVNNLQGK